MAVTRGDVGLLLGLAGFLLGAGAFYQSFRTGEAQRDAQAALDFDREMLDTLVNENTANKEALAEANKRISSLRKELTDGMNEVAGLRKRVDELERAR